MKMSYIKKFQRWLAPQERKNALFFRAVGEKVDAYLFRERLLILVVILVVLFAIWYFIMFIPTRDVTLSYDLKTKTVAQQFKALEKEYNVLVTQIVNAAGQKKQQLLKEEIKRLDENIAKIALQVVPSNQMADLLKDLLVKEGGLKFVSLKSLPAKALVSPEDLAAVDQYFLLEQGMRFTFQGNYFNTLKYLQSIEKSKWRLFWDELDYKVQAYPNALVTIDVHTLVQYKTSTQAAKSLSEAQPKSKSRVKSQSRIKTAVDIAKKAAVINIPDAEFLLKGKKK